MLDTSWPPFDVADCPSDRTGRIVQRQLDIALLLISLYNNEEKRCLNEATCLYHIASGSASHLRYIIASAKLRGRPYTHTISGGGTICENTPTHIPRKQQADLFTRLPTDLQTYLPMERSFLRPFRFKRNPTLHKLNVPRFPRVSFLLFDVILLCYLAPHQFEYAGF